MAETKNVNIQKRKSKFQSRIEPLIYLLLGISILVILVINTFKYGLFGWQGWLIIGLLSLTLISFRNYHYIRQLSALEFLSPNTFQRYQVTLGLAFLGFLLTIISLPGETISHTLPDTVPFPINAIFYLGVGLLTGFLLIIINLHIPVRSRDYELVAEEKKQVRLDLCHMTYLIKIYNIWHGCFDSFRI